MSLQNGNLVEENVFWGLRSYDKFSSKTTYYSQMPVEDVEDKGGKEIWHLKGQYHAMASLSISIYLSISYICIYLFIYLYYKVSVRLPLQSCIFVSHFFLLLFFLLFCPYNFKYIIILSFLILIFFSFYLLF